ncbi:MAG TPA: hypothetical protein VM425_15735 [Myxococcota bacterium]|nr:hypothetical protein [Myxococcota bacterium]
MKRLHFAKLPVLACLLWSAGLSAGPPISKDKASAEQPAARALDKKALAEFALAHSRARDALMAVEARLALLSEKVFDSRLVVRYHGETDTPFRVARIELDLDGARAYRNDFNKAPTAQAIKLFDGYLPPGRHLLRLRVFARGPDDPPGSQPGYFAGSGLTVHLREKTTCTASFDVEQDGDSPGSRVLSNPEPDGSWNIEINAGFETKAK